MKFFVVLRSNSFVVQPKVNNDAADDNSVVGLKPNLRFTRQYNGVGVVSNIIFLLTIFQ